MRAITDPRPLDEIVNGVWAIAGPGFANLDAATCRHIESLVLEAYERGHQDMQAML